MKKDCVGLAFPLLLPQLTLLIGDQSLSTNKRQVEDTALGGGPPKGPAWLHYEVFLRDPCISASNIELKDISLLTQFKL